MTDTPTRQAAEAAGAPQTTPVTTDLTGRTVDRYTIRERLGEGGMGEVYLAEDTLLKRSVALKRISPELRADPYYRQRFLKEAERASKVSDPHIAGIHDVIEENGDVFLVMEYVEGETLRTHAGRPMAVREFLPIAIQCAEALVAAHAQNLVHCDIKPENLIVTRTGRLKVLDFGVARPMPAGADKLTSSTTAERTGEHMGGTMVYMAPETLLKRFWDARSDLWSLGVVFYEALSGQHPFRGETPIATCNNILNAPHRPLHEVNSGVSLELERIVDKLLAKPPENRYATAADLLVDLRHLQAARGTRGSLEELLRRRRRAWLGLGILVLAAAAAGWIFSALKPGPVFAERDWLLISDMENKTGEALFDHTINELLIVALQQSRYVNIVSHAQVVDAGRRMGRTDMEKVDAATGREICLRENYRAMLAGTVEKSGNSYLLTLQVTDPRRDLPVLRESEPFASQATVIVAVDQLSRRLRGKLGESLAQIEKNTRSLEQATTPSLAALERYSLAVRHYANGDWQRCLDVAATALELDPGFAMAHKYAADSYLRLGNDQKWREHLELAVQGLNRVGERERLLILATAAAAQSQYERAAENYRQLTELYPDDVQGHRGLAEVSVWNGHLDEAIKSARRVVELDSASPLAHARLMDYLVRAGRFQESVDEYGKCRAAGITSPLLDYHAGLGWMGLDNFAEAQRKFEAMAKSGRTYEENLAQFQLSRLLIYQGRLAEAEDALRTGLILDTKLGSERWIRARRYLLARTQVLRGRKREAAAEAEKLEAVALRDKEPELLRRAGVLAVAVGQLDRARKLETELARQSAHGSSFTQSCYQQLRGAIRLAEGRLDEAFEAFRTATVYFTMTDAYLGQADVLAARADWPAAAGAYQKYIGFKGAVLADEFPADWMLARQRLATAYEKTGDADAAIRERQQVSELWNRADAGLLKTAPAKSPAKAGSRP